MPEPIFKAERPKSALRHAWWALPLLFLAILLWMRPWAAPDPVVFKMKPSDTIRALARSTGKAASAPAAARPQDGSVEVKLLPLAPASGASR